MAAPLPEPSPAAAGASPPAWLDVWLEAGREGQVFTYANPERQPVGPGDLVEVPLQGRRHAGLVVGGRDLPPPELAETRIQPIGGLLQTAAVDPTWRSLVDAVADACHTSRFRTLKSALPPGWLGQRRRGAPTGSGRALVWLERHGDPPEPRESLTPRQGELLQWLAARNQGAFLRDLLAEGGFGRDLVGGLEQRGWLRRRLVREPLRGRDPGRCDTAPTPAPSLSPEQAAAVGAIRSADPGQTLLLWGVTGAGKTEVYLQAAAPELAAGRSVLLLAPEIGLIPQLLDRARARLGPEVLEYHSGMGPAERVGAWRRCLEAGAAGSPLLVVGTRSAIFLPLERLALIVLDEEHDSSYKQDSPMPCYHARDVARLRADLCGARLVLGSAMPSLESWCRTRGPAADTALVRLPERIGGRPLPPVRVVDMRLELAEGHRRLISRALMDRLAALQERGEQAVVLVPRRGYRSFLSCRSCGEAVLCPHCDVSLTVHRGGGQEWLRCHWCDHRQAIGQRCSHCGSTAFKPFGAGTQRVQEQLAAELEGLRTLRFDQDTTGGRDGHRRLLERFAAGEADVLVGTQMLAKGMDLPRVTLAAVLAADGLLHRPDLRAGEQSLQLLLQLAGRAGRGERPGEVLVQTYCPEHPVIRHLVDGRYERFLEEELALRRHGGLVPFRRAALLRLAGPSASRTATAATALTERIRADLIHRGWCAIGPAPAPVARVAGRSRWQVLLHGPAGGVGPQPLPLPPEAELRALLPSGIHLTIDPDPLQL